MTQTINTYLDLSRRGLNGIGMIYANSPENEFTKLGIPTINTTEDSHYLKMKSDLGLPSQINDGDAIAVDVPLYPFSKRFYWAQYAIGRRVTETVLETDQYGVDTVEMIGSELVRSHVRGENSLAATLLNFAFTNSAPWLGPDGKPLSTNEDDGIGGHPLESGVDNNRGVETSAGTWADVALSATSVVQAATEMEKQNGYKGEPMYKKGPYTLVTGRHLHNDAKVIVTSQLKQGTNNNDMNMANEVVSACVSNSYIQSITSWFMIDNTTGHGLFKLLNKAPDHQVEYFTETRQILHNSVAKLLYSFYTHYGFWASDGTP